ncbi:MAG: hypothetical protein ACYTBJ_01010 [Planctomycetota bacterium]
MEYSEILFKDWLDSIRLVKADGSEVSQRLDTDDSDDPEDDRAEGQCKTCFYYQGDYRCPAYPKRIPDAILGDVMVHDKIYPTQKGSYTWKRRRK